ncbi:hypothetical protein [Methylobacterium sp. V23]|uniref:hypothetical protein n=1 Tax=Methylobacterium sp. V23 TaxID=2044878 RepID=UPI0015E171A1|nr:hypothetical protein [Methylobacterium sp. V23]
MPHDQIPGGVECMHAGGVHIRQLVAFLVNGEPLRAGTMSDAEEVGLSQKFLPQEFMLSAWAHPVSMERCRPSSSSFASFSKAGEEGNG